MWIKQKNIQILSRIQVFLFRFRQAKRAFLVFSLIKSKKAYKFISLTMVFENSIHYI